MIQRDSWVINLECDECGDFLARDFYADDFRGMIEFAKTSGWAIRRDDRGEWGHLCEDCKPSRIADQRAKFGL